MRTAVQPTGIERRFGDDELIVSKTDLRGRITYANDVFLRIACYEEDEIMGKPHNIIRHPDMPRCVFQYLWDTIQDGQEIFAYVVNLARDGAHYWVFAHVTPSFGPNGEIVGYHSNRRTPSRAAVDAVTGVYAELRKVESEVSNPVAAIQAGLQRLLAILGDAGVSYSEFVWSLEPNEVPA